MYRHYCSKKRKHEEARAKEIAYVQALTKSIQLRSYLVAAFGNRWPKNVLSQLNFVKNIKPVIDNDYSAARRRIAELNASGKGSHIEPIA